MTRVVVHAGYHKTGTTSLQDFMFKNKRLLSPYLHYYGKMDFLKAGSDARIYAQRPFPWRLQKFRKTFRKFLKTVPNEGTILLSRETFSGVMPGHHRLGGALVRSYFGPSLKLARVIISELRRRFGKDVDITFFYTTREREAWIRSVYGHLLRSIRLTDDFDTFRARFPALASPAEEAARMAGALHPIPVVTAALEEYGNHKEGPAAGLLELLEIPAKIRRSLVTIPAKNTGQTAALRDQFLALNRQGLRREALRHAKAELLQEAHRHA